MAHAVEHESPLYGVMAEFDSVQAVIEASTRAVSAGFTKLEAYSPFPIEELNDIIHRRRTKLSSLVLMGGLSGMATGFALQYWAAALEYPMNVGGRPYATWPAFVVPSYELTILFSALTAAIGMFALNRLPQPYHPVFNVERFSMASSDKFFLVIEADDPRFDHGGTTRFLQEQGAKGVYDVAS
jgi:Alternative complex III, ActD subunit